MKHNLWILLFADNLFVRTKMSKMAEMKSYFLNMFHLVGAQSKLPVSGQLLQQTVAGNPGRRPCPCQTWCQRSSWNPQNRTGAKPYCRRVLWCTNSCRRAQGCTSETPFRPSLPSRTGATPFGPTRHWSRSIQPAHWVNDQAWNKKIFGISP